MNDLISRLAKRKHSVVAFRIDTAAELRKRIDDGAVILKFLGTQGGTELWIGLDKSKTTLTDADFDQGTGTVHLVGNLVLDYQPIEVAADLDLKTLKGKGKVIVRTKRQDLTIDTCGARNGGAPVTVP